MLEYTKVVSKSDKDGVEDVGFVRKPTAKDYKEAKLYSNAIVASMLRQRTTDGKPAFIVRAQLPELRKEAGIWTDKHSNRVIELGELVKEKEKALKAGGIKLSEAKNLAFELEDLRAEWFDLLKRLNALDEQTIEATSENSEFDYLVSVCSMDETGNRLFESVDDYKQKAGDKQLYFDLAKKLQNILYSTDSVDESIKERTEYVFLRKHGFMNDDMALINKDGHLVDRNGKLIDKDGNYVNSNNERVDFDGNKINEDGSRVVEFGEFLED